MANVLKIYLIFSLLFGVQLARAQEEIVPSQLSSLNLWFKADSGIVLVDDEIETWQESSGNMNNAVANPTERPILLNSVTELAGLPAARFDGVNDFMSYTEVNNFRTIFFLIKHTTGSQDFPSILGHSSENDFASGGANTNATNKLFQANTSPFIKNGTARLNGLDMPPLDLPKPTQYSVISLVTIGNVLAERLTRDRNVTTRVWNGDYAEVIGFNEPLSEEQVIGIETYLMNKYAPPLDLPDEIFSDIFCPMTIEAGEHFENPSWSTGSETTSTVVSESGTYSVEVTDIFGRFYSDTVTVTFPGNFIDSFLLCEGNDSLWGTALDPNVFSFEWNDNSTNSQFLIDDAGDYYVTVLDTAGCSFESDTASVMLDSFSTLANLGPDADLCSGNELELQIGAEVAESYTWNDNSTNSVLVVQNSGDYWLEVVNESGCVAQDTITVNIIGAAPVADFSYSGSCENDTVQFTNFSSAAAGDALIAYSWDFGDYGTSGNPDPFHIYPDIGEFEVTLSIETEVGCFESIALTIPIFSKPVAAMSVGTPCSGKLTSFTDVSSVVGGSIASSNWTFGTDGGGTGINTSFEFSGAGLKIIELITVTNKGCRDTTETEIEVFGSPISNYDFTPVCLGDPTFFNATPDTTGAGPIQSYLWSFLGANNFPQTTHLFNAPGLYPVQLTVTAQTGCVDDTTITIGVFEDPVAYFLSGPACDGEFVEFQDSTLLSFGDSIASWSWNFEGQGQSNVQNPNFTFLGAGDFDVALEVTSETGCSDDVEIEITIGPNPTANFDFGPTIGLPPLDVSFTDLSSGGVDYLWTFDSQSTSIETDPLFTYLDTGLFSITLVVTNEFGCADLHTDQIFVTEALTNICLNLIDCTRNGEYIQPVVSFTNLGNFPLDEMSISMEIFNGSKVIEQWTGSLDIGETEVFTTNSALYFVEGEQAPYFCVELLPAPSRSDTDLENNRLCKNIIESDVSTWSSPQPNPASSVVNFQFINARDGEMLIEIVNERGQMVRSDRFEVGGSIVDDIQVDTSSLDDGQYYFRLSQGNRTETYSIIILDNER